MFFSSSLLATLLVRCNESSVCTVHEAVFDLTFVVDSSFVLAPLLFAIAVELLNFR